MPALRTIARTALTLLVAGATTVAVVPVAAQGYHGGGGFHGGVGGGFRGGDYRGGGYRGFGGFGYRGYGGYYGGFGVGDALLGALVIGGTAAVIASQRDYYEPVYPAYPVPVAPAYGYGRAAAGLCPPAGVCPAGLWPAPAGL